ncbi:MAG: hypothetical protein WEA58_15630 [Balneolaceae bacterium]
MSIKSVLIKEVNRKLSIVGNNTEFVGAKEISCTSACPRVKEVIFSAVFDKSTID